MSHHIPPMPGGSTPQPQPQSYEPSPSYSVPPEQQLVYESTPPAFPAAAEHPEWSQQPMRPRTQPKSPWLFVGIGSAFGLALGLIIGLIAIPTISAGMASQAEALAPSPFMVALDSCDMDDSAYATIGDDGASLELQTFGDEAAGMDFGELTCITESLDVSDAVMSRIETTRALDGRQEASWGDFTASWTYHPDNGLNMLIERAPNDES